MTMRNPEPLMNGHSRLYTVPGKPGRRRYVVTFPKAEAEWAFYLLFREGPAGRIRFDRVQVERLPADAADAGE
jgi:hypothetical protein